MEGFDPAKDFKLDYVGMPMEAAQMLAAGRVDSAILSEPAATGAIMMAAKQGRTLLRAIDLQEVWIKHKGGDGIPMVGVGLHASLIEEAPQVLPLLRDGLPAARDWCSPTGRKPPSLRKIHAVPGAYFSRRARPCQAQSLLGNERARRP